MRVQRMVDETGNPMGFDARPWLDQWLSKLTPRLGDRLPIDVLREPGGLDAVRNALMGTRTEASNGGTP